MSRRSVLCASVALGALLAGAALPARADSIYSNFGSGLQSNWLTTGEVYQYTGADLFTPTASGTLTQVVLQIYTASGSPNLTVYLDSDNGGVPGSVLDTLTTTQTLPSQGNQAPITFTCSVCSQLTVGTNYFVLLTNPTPGTLAGWIESNSYGYLEGYDTYQGWQNINYDALGALEVDATTAVPEPASLILVLTGLLAIAGLFLRGRGATAATMPAPTVQ